MRSALALLALASAAAPLTAAAQAAPDVADLIGARAAGGETQLLSRGYENKAGNVVRDTRYTFWWNARTGRCISVATADGRYAAIIAVPAENCGNGSAGGQYSPPADHHNDRADPGYRDAGSLVLVCYGGGNRPTVTSRPDYQWNSHKHSWEWSNRLDSSSENFSSDVQIELYGSEGRIQLGPKLVPPIHSGDDHGWWDLDNVVVTADTITASYRLNGLNKPKVKIDRRSGLINIKGMTDFSGRCDAGDWGAGQRRF